MLAEGDISLMSYSAIKHRMKKSKKSSLVYWSVLTAVMLAISLVFKAIFHFVPFLNGYSIEFYLVGYVFGLIVIQPKVYRLGFFLVCPWFLMIIPPSIANIADMLMEYVLAFYIFIPMFFLNEIWKAIETKLEKKANKDKVLLSLKFITFIVFFIFCVAIKLTIHTIAGAIWWLPGDWKGSFIFNLPIYGATLLIDLPLAIIIFKPIIDLKENLIRKYT